MLFTASAPCSEIERRGATDIPIRGIVTLAVQCFYSRTKDLYGMIKNYIFPVFMLALSAFTIYQFYVHPSTYLIPVNAGLGILAATMFFFEVDGYRGMTRLWIVLQLLVITQFFSEPLPSGKIEKQVFDFTQYLAIHLNEFLPQKLEFSISSKVYRLYINLFPIVYLIVFELLKGNTVNLIGQRLSLRLYRDNELLNQQLPQESKVVDMINFPKSKDWCLVKLSHEIQMGKKLYRYGMVKTKDGSRLKPNVRKMAYFRLVQPDERLKNRTARLEAYPFVDWVFVE